MESYILQGVFVILVMIVSYKIGVKRGINSPYAFGDTESEVFFKSGKTHNETCNKIEMIIFEKNHFEKKVKDSTEIIKRLEWLFFWFCDSLHNTGRDYLSENNLTIDELKEFKQQVLNANSMLANSRSFFTANIVRDDAKYLALIDFIEGTPSRKCVLQNNVSYKTEEDFGKKLSVLRDLCLKNEPEEAAFYLLKEPNVGKIY